MENLAMKELERGREYVNQLQRLIVKSDNGEDEEALTRSYAQDLAAKVEDSLRNAILLLNNEDSPVNSDVSHQRCESRSHNIKDPRRCSPQKRKSIQTWGDYSKIGPKNDGYAWRKYGEKFILNSKHPRCYFRCTYKHEQGCKATKQVQMIQNDPPFYKTTYFCYHTCSMPHIFLDYHDHSSSTTRLINFDKNHKNKTTSDQNNNSTTFLTQSSFPRPLRNVEKYCKNIKKGNINDYVPSSSSNDCLLSPDEVLPFESDDLIDVISS